MNATIEDCLFSVSATHSGYRRSRNEDALLARDQSGLWAIADGMGGHERGAEASQTVVATLDAAARGARPGGPETTIIPALEQANAEARRFGDAHANGDIVGSTAIVLALEGADFQCFWVGDSRAYLMRDGQLQRITRDHSESLDGISPAVLTRAIGAEANVDVESVCGELYEDDIFLLCSDGLTSVVDETTIAATLNQAEPAAVADCLVGEALAEGGPDNISVIAVFVRGGTG